MKPTLPFISLFDIKKQSSYEIGDIIAFYGKNGYKYCHRIIRIDNIFFTTKGDNRQVSKKYEIDVPVENILGKIQR